VTAIGVELVVGGSSAVWQPESTEAMMRAAIVFFIG